MHYVNLIGFVAGALTTLAYVPEVAMTFRTKSAKELDTAWIVIAAVGTALWAVYGFVVMSYPVILANIASIFLVLSLLYAKMRWG